MFHEQDVRNFGSVPGYGLTLHSIPWISFFESLNSIIRCTCSSNLHFPKKNSIKWNKLTKYSKQFGKCTKFWHGVPSIVRGLQKKFGGQNTKKKLVCRVSSFDTRQTCSLPSASCQALAKLFPLPSVRGDTRQRACQIFLKMFAECLSTRHLAKWYFFKKIRCSAV